MTMKFGYLMICYGLFLAAMGLAGYASNPEKAKTALLSGGTFGALSMLWGWFMTRGANWSRWAALATTVLLTAVFTWRASVSWMAYADGASEKRVAALLITSMGAASLAMLIALLWTARQPQTKLPPYWGRDAKQKPEDKSGHEIRLHPLAPERPAPGGQSRAGRGPGTRRTGPARLHS